MKKRINRLGPFTLALISLVLLCSAIICLNPCFAEGLRFPPESEDELLKHFTYEIPLKDWTSKLSKQLPNSDYALEFRTNRKYEVVFLLRVEIPLENCKREYESCGDRIIAVLKIPKHASNEAINFNCRLKKEKLKTDTVVFGLIKNRMKAGYYSPRLAWRVKFDTLALEPIDGKSVECGLGTAKKNWDGSI